MGLFDDLQSVLGGGRNSAVADAPAGGLGGLGSILSSGAMGSIARSILTNKKGDFSWLKGALVAGAGSMLWNKLTQRVGESNAAVDPRYGSVQATPDQHAERMIRALIFAAKSDGHIDADEQAAINSQIRTLNLGSEGEALIQKAMNEPLDPNLVANGVNNAQEALQIYALSNAVIDTDQFMERAYLDGLAKALRIPDDVRAQVDRQVREHR